MRYHLALIAASLLMGGSARAQSPEQLQASFEQLAKREQSPISYHESMIPGAFATLRLSRAGHCRTNVRLITTAYTVNGKSVTSSDATFEINWSKTRSARQVNGHGLVLGTGKTRITLPIDYKREQQELASELIVACGGLSSANTVLPAEAPARWAQVRDTSVPGMIMCRYVKVPQLKIAQGYGHATWEQNFGAKVGNNRTGLNLTYAKGSAKLLMHGLTLLAPTAAGFSARADKLEWIVDGKPLWTTPIWGSQALVVATREEEWGPVLAALPTASTLMTRVLSVEGRVLLEQIFDVSTVRHVPTALASTDWNCVLD